MKKSILILSVLSLLFSCSNDNKLDVDVTSIESNFKIKRFDQIFYTAKPVDLSKIKKEFRFLFPHDIDSIWVKKMNDKEEQELFRETQKVYPNMNKVKPELISLFKHIKYYYPKFIEPTIITINSNINLDQKVVYADSLLFLSLDVFLGRDDYVYEYHPEYLKNNFTKEQMIVSSAKELVNPILFKSKDRTFLSRIIQEGKKMYAVDAFLPKYSNADKMGYSLKKLEWIEMNEHMIWSYFIEKEYLYSTDMELTKRFIMEAPFSKFYLDIDNESPGQVGVWLGWQIVKSYMQHNKDVALKDLMTTENEIVFKKSKYKPNR